MKEAKELVRRYFSLDYELIDFLFFLLWLPPVDECMEIKNKEIATHLSLPPVKLHCSMLAEDAIKAAIADYKKKMGASAEASAEAEK
tara:strand:- start:1048 stop:1308 length:261 start_codon:yes stop_codon:yes gene_type:complete